MIEIGTTQTLRGLYGSEISINRAVGYCYHHHAALTVKTLKKHECLNKQCNALCKYNEHDFWRQHEQKKAWRRARKENMN